MNRQDSMMKLGLKEKDYRALFEMQILAKKTQG